MDARFPVREGTWTQRACALLDGRERREKERESQKEGARENASSFPWDYSSLGLGGTRCFYNKMTDQLPKLSQAF